MADLTTEDANEILQRAISELGDQSQITRFSPGSMARTILGILSSETERMEDILSANIVLSLVSGATGEFLDFIGDLVGVPRVLPETALSEAEDQIIRIKVPNALTAGDLNGGASISIPAGRIIRSSDSKYKYSLIGNHTLLPGDTEIYVTARSITKGIAGNVAAFTLTKLDYTNYLTYPELELEVENISAIENGAEEEEDEFYRFRIQNALLAAEAGNLTAVRLAVLSVPGVADIAALEMFRGIATADIIVDTVLGDVSNTTLSIVQSNIERVKSVGMSVISRAPDLIGLEVTFKLKFKNGLSTQVKTAARNAVRAAIADVVASVELGGELPINDLAFAARNAHEGIADIGSPNKPIEEIILWRTSPIAGRMPMRLPANKDIELKLDQRLTLEGSLDNAVKIV